MLNTVDFYSKSSVMNWSLVSIAAWNWAQSEKKLTDAFIATCCVCPMQSVNIIVITHAFICDTQKSLVRGYVEVDYWSMSLYPYDPFKISQNTCINTRLKHAIYPLTFSFDLTIDFLLKVSAGVELLQSGTVKPYALINPSSAQSWCRINWSGSSKLAHQNWII